MDIITIYHNKHEQYLILNVVLINRKKLNFLTIHNDGPKTPENTGAE